MNRGDRERASVGLPPDGYSDSYFGHADDPAEWQQHVDYEERGRVKLTGSRPRWRKTRRIAGAILGVRVRVSTVNTSSGVELRLTVWSFASWQLTVGWWVAG
jgi:hypothetical protein